MNIPHFIHFTTNRHLGDFYFGVIKNNATLNSFLPALWCPYTHISVVNILGNGILRLQGIHMLILEDTAK